MLLIPHVECTNNIISKTFLVLTFVKKFVYQYSSILYIAQFVNQGNVNQRRKGNMLEYTGGRLRQSTSCVNAYPMQTHWSYIPITWV